MQASTKLMAKAKQMAITPDLHRIPPPKIDTFAVSRYPISAAKLFLVSYFMVMIHSVDSDSNVDVNASNKVNKGIQTIQLTYSNA